MNLKEFTKGFFILILFLITCAFFYILSPYFATILWAAILAVIFNPVKNKLCSMLGGRNELASFLTIGIICLIVFIPLTIILSSLLIELNTVYIKLTQNNSVIPKIISNFLLNLPNWTSIFLINHNLTNIIYIQKQLSDLVLQGGQYLAGSAFLIGKGTFGFIVSISIMLYLIFFLLKEGQFLIGRILDSLPLSNYAKYHLFAKFVAVSRAMVKGTLVVSVIQGILGSFALYVSGIDGSILWGVLISFLSLIPTIGSAIIWIPAAIYLFAINQIWQSFFIIVFFMIIIGLVDNVLRPLLIGKDTKIPDYLILITTLGGMKMYGINGFIYGPLIAALFIACWNLLSWHDYISNNEELNKTTFEKK